MCCCWRARPRLGRSADSAFDKKNPSFAGAKSVFSAVTDVSTVTPCGDAPGWRAAVKLVEDAQILWRNSAAVPRQLPAPASGPQLTLSPGFASECFSVLFCSPLEALSLWQIDGGMGGVPSGRAAICPPSRWHNPDHHHFGMGFLSAPRGQVFPLMTAEWSKHLSWWDESTRKPCPTTGQPSILPS